MKRRVIVIFKSQSFPLHNTPEYKIDKIQYSSARTKIIVKINIFSLSGVKGPLPPYKYGRVSIAEAVYALLYISHIKYIVPLGKPGEDMLLQFIVVLILVHKYVIVSVS